MNETISIFIPTRRGSERVKNKNTRPFAGVEGGLLYLKLRTILGLTNIDEIILSTNDKDSIEIAKNIDDRRLKIDVRPEQLCQSSTKVSDLIRYVPKIIKSEHIFWLHVTTPFISITDYQDALDVYFDNLYNGINDSLLSVTRIQQFLWDDENKSMINCDISNGNWPRTQDLKPLYEINHAFYINSRNNYLKYGNRVSPNFSIFELNKLSAFDIDWEEDFEIAEAIFNQKFNK